MRVASVLNCGKEFELLPRGSGEGLEEGELQGKVTGGRKGWQGQARQAAGGGAATAARWADVAGLGHSRDRYVEL